MTPWSPKASGTARAQTNIAPMTTNIAIRTSPSSGFRVFVSHAYAAHAHQSAASTTRPRSSPPQVGSRESSAVTCVIAKTKTRSKKSSSGVTRSTRGDASTRTDAIGSVHDQNVARRPAHEPCADGAVDQSAQPAPAPDDDHSGPALLGGGADLARRVANGLVWGHAHVPFSEECLCLVEHLQLAPPLSVDEGPHSSTHRLRADHVDHVEASAATDELGCMDQRSLGRLRTVVADEDLHGRW